MVNCYIIPALKTVQGRLPVFLKLYKSRIRENQDLIVLNNTPVLNTVNNVTIKLLIGL